MSEIWSNTDFPYMCLKDEARTLAFRDAIQAVVRPGDVVVDVGAGTGILSFFAAEAGAAQVLAVEIDPVSAAALRRSIALNPGIADRVRVVEGDAAVVDLPRAVDVVVAEIIETGLLDEQQVPVLNALRRRGVITRATRVVPARYETTLELVDSDHRYYGFSIAAPKHEWPFYAAGPGWLPTPVTATSAAVVSATVDFAQGFIGEQVAGQAEVDIDPSMETNAVRLAGTLGLSAWHALGRPTRSTATRRCGSSARWRMRPSIRSPGRSPRRQQILPIPPIRGVSRVTLRWRYRMGAGLGGLELACEPAAARDEALAR